MGAVRLEALRQLARSSLGPFSIIRHVGRRSGKPYETPIIVAPHAGGFVIELTYGPEVPLLRAVPPISTARAG